MGKKTIIVAMLWQICCQCLNAQTLKDGIYYNLDNTALTASVVSGDDAYSGDVTIPASIMYEENTYSVTSIAEEAFKGCTGLTSISIPASVTTSGKDAFSGCTGLTKAQFSSIEALCRMTIAGNIYANPLTQAHHLYVGGSEVTDVVIPDGITNIGFATFYGCTSITSFEIPASVRTIERNAFNGCTALKSLIIPEGVKTISDYVFWNCTALESVILPSTLNSISDYSFYGCSALTKVRIDKATPIAIQEHLFTNSANAALYVPQGAKDAYSESDFWEDFQKIVALAGPADDVITFADSNVKTICVTNWDLDGDGEVSYYEAAKIEDLNAKFVNKTAITSFDELQYFTGLASIRASSFSGCTGLASISIPANVTIINQAAFKNCTHLENLTICDGTTALTLTYQQLRDTSTGKQAESLFNDCPLTTLYIGRDLQYQDVNEYGTSSTLYAFRNSAITSITFGRVMGTANLSFSTNNVSTLLIPGNIKNYNCTGLKLTSVTIENGVESIGSNAFSGCSGLTSVTIPESVTSIGGSAFRNCSGLTSITVPSNVLTLGQSAFAGCTGLKKVTIEDSEQGLYIEVAAGTVTYTNYFPSTLLTDVYVGRDIEYPFKRDNSSNIYMPFGGQKSIKRVKFGNKVNFIGPRLFKDCTNLEAIEIPSSVERVDTAAFSGCTMLTSLKLPATPIRLMPSAFSGCTRLAKLNIPGGVEFAGSSVFSGCTRLGSVKIAEGVKNIGERSFYGCTSMTSLTLPNTLETIGNSAFYECDGLTAVSFPDNLDSIGSSAFQHCTGLTSANIPKASLIGQYAFASCTGLQSVVLGDGVQTINTEAFAGCTGLETLILGRNIKDFCVKQSSSDLPERYDQFKNCTGLKTVYCYATNIPTAYYSYNASMSAIYSYTAFSGHTNATLYVPSSKLSSYKTKNNWKDFKNIYALSGDEESTSVSLTDGDTYDGERTTELTTLSYTRTFNNTNWQALYVPFAMQYDDWKDNFNIAFINDVHQEEGEGPYVEARHLKAGDRTEANTPYLIQAKSSGEKALTPTEKTLYPAEENSFELTSWNEIFTITGTYTGVSGTEMFNNGNYAMGGGTLHKTNSSANGLAPYRWYMTINDRSGNPVDLGNEVKIIMIDEFGVETDEIISINNDNRTSSDDRCYDISGRPVSHPTKGLYIRNGKKILVGSASR